MLSREVIFTPLNGHHESVSLSASICVPLPPFLPLSSCVSLCGCAFHSPLSLHSLSVRSLAPGKVGESAANCCCCSRRETQTERERRRRGLLTAAVTAVKSPSPLSLSASLSRFSLVTAEREDDDERERRTERERDIPTHGKRAFVFLSPLQSFASRHDQSRQRETREHRRRWPLTASFSLSFCTNSNPSPTSTDSSGQHHQESDCCCGNFLAKSIQTHTHTVCG